MADVSDRNELASQSQAGQSAKHLKHGVKRCPYTIGSWTEAGRVGHKCLILLSTYMLLL